MKYKIIFLDWNGTLSNSKFWGQWENRDHPKHKLFSKIESALFGELRDLLNPWMRGEMRSEEIIDQISKKTGIDYELLYSEFIESCKGMLFVSENIQSMVSKIRSMGIKVAIATDNMDSFSRWTIPSLNLLETFDDILESSTLKVMKRDFDETGSSLFFRDYLKKNNIFPNECLLIDDGVDKEEKIAKYGIEYRRILSGDLAKELDQYSH